MKASALTYLDVLENYYPDNTVVVGGSTRFLENGGVSFQIQEDPEVAEVARALSGGNRQTWNCWELLHSVLGHTTHWKRLGLTARVLAPGSLLSTRMMLFGESIPLRPVAYHHMRVVFSDRGPLRTEELCSLSCWDDTSATGGPGSDLEKRVGFGTRVTVSGDVLSLLFTAGGSVTDSG